MTVLPTLVFVPQTEIGDELRCPVGRLCVAKCNVVEIGLVWFSTSILGIQNERLDSKSLSGVVVGNQYGNQLFDACNWLPG